jgi:hypothetical protein
MRGSAAVFPLVHRNTGTLSRSANDPVVLKIGCGSGLVNHESRFLTLPDID